MYAFDDCNHYLKLFSQAISVKGQESTLQTDYILKVVHHLSFIQLNILTNFLWTVSDFCYLNVLQILGLDICADTKVGDAIRRGISGGQKKRLTTGSGCLRVNI